MGKKSFSQRRKKPPVSVVAPAAPPAPHVDAEDEFDDVDHSALNHGFKSYQEALEYCVKDGWREAIHVPSFSSAALVETLNQKIKSDVLVQDRTLLVPTGPSGNYSVVPWLSFQTTRRSMEDPTQAFMFMRTKTNTPAFLCGCLATQAAMHGDIEIAREFVRVNGTPAGFLVHYGKQYVLPTMVCQGSAEQAAAMLSAMLDNDPEKFCCSACGKTLMSFERTEQRPEGTWTTDNLLAYDCGHAFHPACIREHYQEHGNCCSICTKYTQTDTQAER